MAAASPTPAKRGCFTVSLRAFLITFTVLVLALGWYANRALRQRAAVKTILAKGGRIYYGFNDPVRTHSENAPPWPAAYLGVDFVATVTVVELIGKDFVDADLALLDDLPNVRWLRIYETNIAGTQFGHVAQRARIKVLLINHSPLEDQALVEIGKMPQLTTLHLVDTNITDKGVRSLGELTKLESLSISECAVSAAGLAECGLPETLTELSLENTRFGDEGMVPLERLPQLHRLSLYGSQVTDRSVPTLVRMQPLKSVMLGETHVSDQRLRALIAARGPALFVSPDPDGQP